MLHRGVGVLPLDDPLGLLEAFLDVALAHLGDVGDVGAGLRAEGGLDEGVIAEVRVNQFGVGLQGLYGIEDRLENLVLDLDEIDRLLGDVDGFRRHGGDSFTEMAHDVLGDDVLVDDVQAELVVQVVAGQDGVNTLQRLGF